MSIMKTAMGILLFAMITCAVKADREADGGTMSALGQQNDVEGRLATEYRMVIRALMPEGFLPTEEFPKDVKWVVTVRVMPPFDNAESYLTVRRSYGGNCQVVVTAPNGASILKQLRGVLKQHPNMKTDEIARQISLSRRTATDSTCPRLKQVVSQFESIRMTPVLPDQLIVDATTYEFWIESLWGNRMHVLLAEPGSTAGRRADPLAAWADSIGSILDACK